VRSLFATLRTLTLPAGAGPGAARTVLGPDVPAELRTFYAAYPFGVYTVNQAILKYDVFGNYEYEANLTLGGNIAVARGFTLSGVVTEFEFSTMLAGIPTTYYGNGSKANYNFRLTGTGSDLTMEGGSLPRGWLYAANITTGAMTAAVSAETNVPSAAINVNVLNGRPYLYHLVCRANLSDMSQAYEIRVRRDTALTGTLVGFYQMTNVGTAATGVWPVVISLPWLSAATENLKLFFSVIRTGAAGTIQLLGSPGAGQARAWVGMEDVGSGWTTA